MKEQIKVLVENYMKNNPQKISSIPVSGKVFDSAELVNIIEAALEGWWTEGHWSVTFEKRLQDFLGINFVHSCNSGSSANLIAIAALC
ncbi:MAG: DegT/DnrJ/EryC1/StrS family aminotransferase, partial [Candidatus Heimdallarchaeota archaeon]|nr:DegT/DnrJ/EryC1/StrS family aminotransferase [Candidatus Heimdallarchaeota archaeon]